MKIMYNAGKDVAAANFCSIFLFSVFCFLFSVFFLFFVQFCVTKMKLLSNFATLRYVFSFGFYFLYVRAQFESVYSGIEFEIVLLWLLPLPLPCPRPHHRTGRRSHSDTVYGFDMALFMQLPQLFMQLQIDFLSLCEN